MIKCSLLGVRQKKTLQAAEFPGGKIEANETPQECLSRKLREELNIDVCVGEFCTEVIHDYGNRIINLFAYYCTILEGEIEISVHDKYEWVKKMTY